MFFPFKKLFTGALAFFFLFLPTCGACGVRAKNTPNYPQTKITFFAPQEKQSLDGVWDVSDVDISYVNENAKYISFTFDDSPSAYTENLLAVFAEFNENNADYQASATLFFNGKKITEADVPTLHAATALRFELGNHTQNHQYLPKLSNDEILREIEETDKLLSRVDKKPLHLFRAPYGAIDERIKTLVSTPVIDWTVDTLDWTGIAKEEIEKSVLQNLADGSIVLMHDGYHATVEAVKNLLPALKNAGFQVLSTSALSKANARPLKNGSVYIRARKPQP